MSATHSNLQAGDNKVSRPLPTTRSNTLTSAVAAFGSAVVLLATDPGHAQDPTKGHIAIENPHKLTPDEANALYEKMKERMSSSYGTAAYDKAKDYLDWKRYNTSPYLSATHGQRYVNNYANDKVTNYGKLQPGERYPVGSIFAKDSISAIDADRTFPGAFFVMEKLKEGESPKTADWRYVMILPDGSLFGDTKGANADKVEYCHTCHVAVADDDYMFFVPEEYR